MTDKNEFGSECDISISEKKANTKLKLIGVLVIMVIGGVSLYPVVFDGKKTPEQKSQAIVKLNPDGKPTEDEKPVASDNEIISMVEDTADNDAADKATADKASTDKATADKAAADKATADNDAAGKATADNDAASKASADNDAAGKATADNDAASKASADNDAAGKATAGQPFTKTNDVNTGSDAGQHILNYPVAISPATEVTPTHESDSNIVNTFPKEDVEGISDAIMNDTTVHATEEAQIVSSGVHYDASKFGIGASPAKVETGLLDRKNNVSSALDSDGTLKNYIGQSVEKTYKIQSQNTVYVYGSFATKVYLLPIGKNEKINAYLSDARGWEVNQLPGDILRIKRSPRESEWSDATDLFLVVGKRTYTIILQAVDQPQMRTDSLRYVDSSDLSIVKPGKK